MGHQIGDLLGCVRDAGLPQRRVVLTPTLQHRLHRFGHTGLAGGAHATHGFGVGDGHDARFDGHVDAGGTGLVKEPVEVGVVVEELGDQMCDARVDLALEVVDVRIQGFGLRMLLRVACAVHLELWSGFTDVGDQVAGVFEHACGGFPLHAVAA